jgi:cytochrome P450
MSTTAAQLAASGFDPFGPSFRRDPRSYYPGLHGDSPGFMVLEGVPSAYIIKYSQVRKALTDFKSLSSVRPRGLPGLQRIDFFNGQPVMNYSDPPQHDRLRRIVNGSFLPARVAAMPGVMGRLVEEQLAKLADRRELDAAKELCKPIATELILGHLMGASQEGQAIFMRYVSTLSLLDKVPPGGSKPKAFLDAWQAGVEYCREALARARREKNEGLIGLIAAANDEGDRMSDEETMAMMLVFMTGGFPTVSGTTAEALKNLALYPAVAERIRAEPELAVRHYEESLRCEPPVTLVMRFAVQDIEIDGKRIAEGMPVYVMIGGACHDPEVFPEPNRFDLDRANFKSHLAFGAGLHACIGANVARAVTPVVIRAVASRFPNLRLTRSHAELDYGALPRVRHLESLPVAV